MTGSPGRIVVLTACTAQKAPSPAPLLRATDFARGRRHIAEHHRRVAATLQPAECLYRGQQHVRLMRGVEAARASGWDVRLAIMSAGYGVVGGDELLAPYECTFKGMTVSQRRVWADDLELPEAVRDVLAVPADLSIVLLGDDYLEASLLGSELVLRGPALVFCGAKAALRIPPVDGLQVVVLHRQDTRRLSSGLVGLKGEIGGRLLIRLATDPGAISELLGGDVLTTLAAEAPTRVAEASLF